METQLNSFLEQGHAHLLKEDFKSAEVCFNRAIALDEKCAMAHNNLGWTYECEGVLTEAVRSYQRALALDSGLTLARVNLASLMAKTGRSQEAMALWNDLIQEGLFDRHLINEAIDTALADGATQYAAKWADICAVFLRGSPRHYTLATPEFSNRDLNPAMLTIETLSHDIDQIKHIQRSKVVDLDFESMLNNYERARASLEASGDRRRRKLNEEEQLLIGDTYGRIWCIRRGPSLGPASPWGAWDPKAVEKAYWDSPLGLCVIDNFLSEDVLNEVRQFCLQSTVWLANHYSHGRLGAFFREGFNSPILVDLAEQFARLFPNLIGDTYRLLQLWGFKYSSSQPNTHPHADFAAANLNFWITPDEANLDPNSGGLIVYDIEAPSEWTHDEYNKGGQQIDAFLRKQQAKAVYIPYRANRAIFFNSDLFHVTAPLRFRPEYENRRINVTMLYGRRAQDQKRPVRLRPRVVARG